MRLKIFLSILLTALISTSALAAEGNIDAKGYAGGLFGVHVPDSDDTSMRGAWGVTGGAKLSSEIGLGVYYFGSSEEEEINNVSTNFDYSLLGVEAAYHFEGSALGTYAGVRVGITNLDIKSTASTIATTPYHFGFVLGYNHWLTPGISIGGEGSFYNVEKEADGGQSVEGFNIVGLMASAKLWF